MSKHKNVEPERQPEEQPDPECINGGISIRQFMFDTCLSKNQLMASLNDDPRLSDRSLERLRNLHRANMEDSDIRAELANEIYAKMRYNRGKMAPAALEALLDELRSLYREDQTDLRVVDRLAEGLSTTRRFARGRDYEVQGEDLMEELRALYRRHQNDSHEVRRVLIMSFLFKMIRAIRTEGDWERAVAHYEEMRAIYLVHYDDIRVRFWLADALNHLLPGAARKHDFETMDWAIDECHALNWAHGDDEEVECLVVLNCAEFLYHARENRGNAAWDKLAEKLELFPEPVVKRIRSYADILRRSVG